MVNLAPSGQIPSSLQGSPWKPLQQQQNQLAGLFDTSGLQSAYQNQASGNLDQGRALAAAAASSYTNRAAQSGASSLGAGFARGQAMLPIYQQNNALMSDFASKQLQAKTSQGQIGSDIAGRIGQLQSARQSMLSDYMQGQQRLQQGNQQFNADLDYRNRALAQNQTQFAGSQNEKGREFDVNAGQQGQMNRLRALQLAMQMPRQNYSWNTNWAGGPINQSDATAMQNFGQQNQFFNGLRSDFQSLF